MTTGRSARLSSEDYRLAVASIIRNLQKNGDLSDAHLATRLGCSTGTIRNARGRATSLDPLILARIEQEFGPGAIDPFLALGKVRAVPLADATLPMDPVLAIVEALHRIVEVQSVDSEGGSRITVAELRKIIEELRHGRTALDALIARAEAIR
ncbi:XRE family transcriptional regulator [Novosphingobium sp.]|uniref:XRE family transcriptional regulator n=1 Tax=Novosphingobium sp. TaxID=1874826 RepID=UPI003D6D2B65